MSISKKQKGIYRKKNWHFPGISKLRKSYSNLKMFIACNAISEAVKCRKEPADWAPDLMLAKTRLKPEWIKKWLLDPQSIQPGTKMPKFFREGEFQEYIPGTPEEQVEVMKDFLMNLWE
ncbi:MAG: hypothetical protein HS127_10220 [Planctomycetia bacterium]|nr:hypothetical protein [Planctomycetia bacterium]